MKPVYHLLLMDDLKLYGANKDQLDSLIQVVRVFSQDTRMSFGLDKCAILEMREEDRLEAVEYTINISKKSKRTVINTLA